MSGLNSTTSSRMKADRYDLQRFVDAQHAVYARATNELRQGRKQTHWMWFVCPLAGRSIEDIFGYPDYLKFHSSMTLFARAATDEGSFIGALAKYFGSTMDPHTIERL